MHKHNYIQMYGDGGGLFGGISNFFSGIFGKKQNNGLTSAPIGESMGVAGIGSNGFGKAGSSRTPSTDPTGGFWAAGGGAKQLGQGLMGGAGSIIGAFTGIGPNATDTERSTAIAGGITNGISSGLLSTGNPALMTVGAGIKAIDGIGGALMNNNATAKAAKNFKINDTVAESSAYGGVNAFASDAMRNGQAYRKAGLFGKIFSNTGGIKNDFNSSNGQQSMAANILDQSNEAKQGALTSSSLFANNLIQKNYNSQLWNNGSVQFGKKGAKLKLEGGTMTQAGSNATKTFETWKKLGTAGKQVNLGRMKGIGAKIPRSQQGGSLFNLDKKAYVDSVLTAHKDLDWVKRLYDPNTPHIQVPGQQFTSTHLMADDGKGYVYPTIVNDGGLKYLQGDAAYDYAKKTKTGIQLPPSEGSWFAANGYKQGTDVLKHQHGGQLGFQTNPVMQQDHTGVVPFNNIDQLGTEPIVKEKFNAIEDPDHGYSKWLGKLPKRLQETNDYDLQGYFDKYGPVKIVGDTHLTDEFKKPNHVTFSNESKYSNDETPGGEWRQAADKKWEFVPSPWNVKNSGLDSLQHYFKEHEPSVRLVIPTHEEGGAINVIADGKLHAHKHSLKELDHLADQALTLKGIPVVSVSDDGVTQHAEVERDELILHYELTKQVELLHKEGTDEAAIQAGRILSKEIVKNTKDSKNKILKNA